MKLDGVKEGCNPSQRNPSLDSRAIDFFFHGFVFFPLRKLLDKGFAFVSSFNDSMPHSLSASADVSLSYLSYTALFYSFFLLCLLVDPLGWPYFTHFLALPMLLCCTSCIWPSFTDSHLRMTQSLLILKNCFSIHTDQSICLFHRSSIFQN